MPEFFSNKDSKSIVIPPSVPTNFQWGNTGELGEFKARGIGKDDGQGQVADRGDREMKGVEREGKCLRIDPGREMTREKDTNVVSCLLI